jgi:hypothetical protein
MCIELWIDADLYTLGKKNALEGRIGWKKAENLAFFSQFASLENYASISYGSSEVSSTRIVSSKPIVSSSAISVRIVETAFSTVSPTGEEGEIGTVSPFSQSSDSSA